MIPGSDRIRRVLMTADTLGGVWTYALDLARALAGHGIDVELATMGAPVSTHQRKDAGSIPNLRLHESSYRLEWMDDPWDDVERAGDWLLALENDLAPDLVHLNGYALGDLPWRAPHLVVGHSCVLSWWRAVKNAPAPGRYANYGRRVAAGLHAADFVVAPSRAMLSELEFDYGSLRATAVVPNGRDPSLYRTGAKEPFILAAGRVWDEAKNLAALGDVQSNWPIYIAGESRHPSGEFRAIPNVCLLGALSAGELTGYYSRAAIYCLPARYEPFGLSVLEAALSGCALVLGDIPSLRENWDGAALFTPVDDPRALERRLRELIEDAARRDSLGGAAYSRALTFTPARMAEGYLAVYRQLVTAASAVARG